MPGAATRLEAQGGLASVAGVENDGRRRRWRAQRLRPHGAHMSERYSLARSPGASATVRARTPAAVPRTIASRFRRTAAV